MTARILVGGGVVVLALAAMATLALGETAGDWTQWGGPNQDFRASSSGLAAEWPEAGPRQLWSRELGEGYSAILAESGRLYTMYRNGEQEAVVCLDAASGETLWEHGYDQSPHEGHVSQFGDGPRGTPLIDGDRLYTIGVAGMMHALNKKNGKVLWKHDLWTEYDGSILNHGYSSSPIVYKDNVIALVGGEDHGLVAFNRKNGKLAWSNLDYKNSYSTPKIFDVDGQDQLIVFMASALIGVDPNDGKLLWEYAHQNQFDQNINMPVMVDNHLFMSSTHAGARGLKLSQKEGKTTVEEIWSTRKIQFYHVTSVLDGDYVYGSTGSQVNFMSAVNVKTGEIAWRKRGFAKANAISADGRLLLLDEEGNLVLATATPEDVTVHSKASVLEEVAWTVPTLVGKTMYVRDKQTIVALDLG
jgi:outer membrane protein assembly factor BamB